MFNVLTLNNIAKIGLSRLPASSYQIGNDVKDPDLVLLRSANMHSGDIPKSLKAVGRAGAGVNNIPIPKMTARGIPVFNTPGANANAVKELVIAGLILACRQICEGWDFARNLEGSDDELSKAVEAQKKTFAGYELPGRTLGVIGLGAIGRLVANTAVVARHERRRFRSWTDGRRRVAALVVGQEGALARRGLSRRRLRHRARAA